MFLYFLSNLLKKYLRRMDMKKIAPKIEDSSAEFIAENFRSLNSGCRYVLDSFKSLHQRTLHEIAGRFTRGELMLMIDCFNATALTAGIAGQHLELNCSDAIDLDNMDQKWEIDGGALKQKLSELTIYEAACLEIWANGFWYGGPGSEGRDIEEYVAALT